MFKGSLTQAKSHLFLLLLLQIGTLHAAPNAALVQARDFLNDQLADGLSAGDRMEIQFAPSHARLKLQPCGTPLSFDNNRPVKPGRFSLKASCQYPKRWSVRINGMVKVYRKVLVSRHALPKGTRLSADNTLLTESETSQLRAGFYSTGDEIAGYEVSRPLRQSQVITPKDLSPPLAIFKGDEVTITAGSGGLMIRMTGIALQDGRKHQQIRVQNKRSGKVIKARVIEAGLVKAGP